MLEISDAECRCPLNKSAHSYAMFSRWFRWKPLLNLKFNLVSGRRAAPLLDSALLPFGMRDISVHSVLRMSAYRSVCFEHVVGKATIGAEASEEHNTIRTSIPRPVACCSRNGGPTGALVDLRVAVEGSGSRAPMLDPVPKED